MLHDLFHDNEKDVLSIIVLICLFTPLYLVNIYTFPWQINTDEATLIGVTRTIAASSPANLFGLSYYAGAPAFIFHIFGWLENALGGINFFHARLIHAFFGLATIALSYIFFRFLTGRFIAFSASIILGINHSFLAISRMAMRDNSAVFIELLAFIFLFLGYRTKKLYYAALAGVCAGLGFYVYYPGRIIIFLLFLALIVFFIKQQSQNERMDIIKIGIVGFFTFLLCITPIAIATMLHTDLTHYQRQQFLFLPEGRQLNQQWFATATAGAAIKKNITNGLTMFTNNIQDQGYIYNNPEHGFVDPVSGILFLLGFALLFVKKSRSTEETIALSSLIILWILFSFMITKAPMYTRLFIILPFFAYTVVTAIARFADTATKNPILQKITISFLLLSIVIANISILHTYWAAGYTKGDELGGTGRYIMEQEAHNNPRVLSIMSNRDYPYFSLNDSIIWQMTWLEGLTNTDRKIMLLESNDFSMIPQPSSILMSQITWGQVGAQLQKMYPTLAIRPLMPDGHIMAIEIGH